LRDALRTRRWGLPEAGGWLDQEAGWLDKMSLALQVYDAITEYARVPAEKKYDWIAKHPDEYAIVQRTRNG
jgi:hypothetical protein